MKTYNFGELEPNTQKKVIEGYTEYMNLTYNKQHSYLEVSDSLIKEDYRYNEGGDVISAKEN